MPNRAGIVPRSRPRLGGAKVLTLAPLALDGWRRPPLRRGRAALTAPLPLRACGGDAGAHRALPLRSCGAGDARTLTAPASPAWGLGTPPRCGSRPPSPHPLPPPPPCGAAPTKGKRHPLHGSRPLRSPRTVPLPPFAPRSAATFPGVRRPRAGDMRAIARKTPARSADRRPNAAGRAALLFGPLPSATLSLPPPNKATAARFRIPSRRATPQLHPAPLASCAGPLGRGPVPPLGRSTPSVDARLKRYGPPADFFSMEIGSRPSAPFRGRTRFPLPSPSPRPLPLSAPFL